MKSFICEEKTILKAIEKAIKLAENPNLFTIKILEQGSSSIFWWQNKSSIILFSYEITEKKEETDNKKYIKKNYSKEEAFLNKKTTDHFKEAEYTSSTKNEIVQKNSQKKEGRISELPAPKNRNEKPKKEFISKSELAPENNLTEKNNQEYKKTETKTVITDGEQIKRKRYTKKDTDEKEIKTTNFCNPPQSLLGAALQGNNVSQIKNHEEENIFDEIEWKSDYIDFIEEWMNKINIDFNFSNNKVSTSIDKSVLVINIFEFNECDFVEKKHLFSSIVILLYEHLKEKFPYFESKSYKIIIK